MKLLRAAVLTIIVAMLGITLSGCDESLSDVETQISSHLSTRKGQEIAQLDALKDNGFISDDVYDKLSTAIDSIKPDSMAKLETIKPYTRTSAYSELEAGAKDYIDFTGGHQEDLNSSIEFTIYKLKPDIASSKSLEQIKQLVEKFSEDKETYRSEMNLLFESTGLPLSAGNLFMQSKPNTDPNVNALGKDLAIRNPYFGMTEEVEGTDKEGNPTTLTQVIASFNGVDCSQECLASIMVYDFNPVVIKALIGATNIEQSKYVADPGGKAAYLLEYPVNYVNQYTVDSTAGTFAAGYAQTPYIYNIKTGAVRFNEKTTDLVPSSSTKNNGNITIESYDVNWGSVDAPLYNENSFMLVNKTSECDVISLSRNTSGGTSSKLEKITVPSIILTDYLEYTIMPEFSTDSDMIALGRIMRLNDTGVTSGKTTDSLGTYVSLTDHKTLLNSESLDQNFGSIGIKDIVQIVPDSDGSYIKLAADGLAASGVTATPVDPTDPTSGDVVVGTESSDDVKYIYKDIVWPAVQFCGSYYENYKTVGTKLLMGEFNSPNAVNKSDKVEKVDTAVAPPMLYGMATSKGIFDSSLFSGWIFKESGEHGSLSQWNKWLGNAGFKYRIDDTALEAYLNGNYSNELRDNGIIILDLGVIANIQGDYNRQDTVDRVTGFRTAFVILGMVLISYGVLLLCSWAFDINIVGGPKLLTALTFGNWIAIGSTDELPNMAVGERHYMTFSKTLKAVIVIIAAGCLLYMVDVVSLVGGLVSLIGKIAELISTSVFGN